MAETIAELLPFAFAGAILPTWTLMVIALLGTARPLANSLAFVTGNVSLRAALGLAVLFAFPDLKPLSLPPLAPGLTVALFGIGAVLLAMLAWRQWTTPPRPEGEKPAWMQRFESISPLAVFAFSAVSVASPGVQWVYFLGGMAEINAPDLPVTSEIALLAAFVLLLQAMLVTPIVVYVAGGRRAAAQLERFKAFLVRRGQRLTAAVLASIALWLAWRVIDSAWGIISG